MSRMIREPAMMMMVEHLIATPTATFVRMFMNIAAWIATNRFQKIVAIIPTTRSLPALQTTVAIKSPKKSATMPVPVPINPASKISVALQVITILHHLV